MTVGGLLDILARTISTRIRPQPHRAESPVPETSEDSVSAFARDLKDRLLAGRYRTVKAFAGDHTLTGLSRSTVYSAIGGARLPTAATTAKLLSAVTAAEEAEIQLWLDRRSVLDIPPGDRRSQDPASTSKPRRTVSVYHAVVAAVGLVVLTNGLTVAMTLAWARHQNSVPASPIAHAATNQPCSPVADLRPYQVVAHVANTQGQGAYARLTPQDHCHTGFLPEADAVTVVCQDLNGPTITDLYAGKSRDWPVWDKLGSGAYIPDLYLDLPKGPRPGLVDQLPAC